MKYIIEINDTPMTTPELGKKLYKAKGFNSLVFDKNGLDKLEKTNETEWYATGYQTGYDTAIENAQATKLDWGEVQYNKGYNDAMRKVSLSGDYEKQFDRGYNQAINDYKKFEDFFNYGHSDERKVGKWVKNEHTFWTCSECGWVNKYNRERYAYCPNCGAKMDKE